MKYYAFIFLLSATILQAQEKLQDTTKIQALEQVYLNGVRVACRFSNYPQQPYKTGPSQTKFRTRHPRAS